MSEIICCTPMSLPKDLQLAAALDALTINPVNAPLSHTGLDKGFLTLMTQKYWGAAGVDLSVQFMDNPTQACRSKILAHMNAWNEFCNVRFRETNGQGDIRIDRGPSGYWSYLGTDIRMIPKNQPTMNLKGFTENTSDSEYRRVVRHETGHTLGYPHEHQTAEVIALLDQNKVLSYFMQTQGWSAAEVRAQVLTPLEKRSITGTTPDVKSIMCYQFPGSLTKSGQPIPGGSDFTATDRDFAGKIYPLAVAPPPPPVNPGFQKVTITVLPDGSVTSSKS